MFRLACRMELLVHSRAATKLTLAPSQFPSSLTPRTPVCSVKLLQIGALAETSAAR